MISGVARDIFSCPDCGHPGSPPPSTALRLQQCHLEGHYPTPALTAKLAGRQLAGDEQLGGGSGKGRGVLFLSVKLAVSGVDNNEGAWSNRGSVER